MTDQHRHDWEPTPSNMFACSGCDETTSACNTCDRPLATALLICDGCLKAARKVITDIGETIMLIPDPWTEARGMHAVKLGGGSPSADDPAKLPFGLDACWDDPEQVGLAGVHTADGCLDALYGWASDWAELRGEIPAPSLDYLLEYTLWAAQTHPAWTEYLADARSIRAKVRHLAGLGPEVQPVPCTDCGGRVLQDWTKAGLDDTLVCTGCAMTWRSLASLTATRDAALIELGRHRLDLLVTIADAKLIRPDIRGNTLDVWVKRAIDHPERAKFPTQGRTRTGQNVYRLADVVTAWNERGDAA